MPADKGRTPFGVPIADGPEMPDFPLGLNERIKQYMDPSGKDRGTKLWAEPAYYGHDQCNKVQTRDFANYRLLTGAITQVVPEKQPGVWESPIQHKQARPDGPLAGETSLNRTVTLKRLR